MGNMFSFTVPKSMTISNVIFDALDSTLLPTESWLSQNARWCTISGTTLSVNSANPSPASSWSVQTIQTEEWKGTLGNSFFQFGYSDTLSNIGGVGTLTISNCVFQNFYYDFTSLIGLTKDYGNVVITGSTFNGFSNWGSIIRDTREYPSLDYTNYLIITSGLITSYRDSMFSINQVQNKFFVEPSSYWTSSSWSSISISSCTFTNFNYLKTGGSTYHLMSSTSNMLYQGIILNLVNFYGTVALNKNTFSEVTFKYNNWEEIYNTGTTTTTSNIWGTGSTAQIKALIFINAKSSSIEIYGNTFTKCNSFLGLIHIERSSTFNGPILIHQNTFTQNSALRGSNVLSLYLYTSVPYTTSFTSSSMICAAVKISSNTFTQNVGCFNTYAAVQAMWYTDSVDSAVTTNKDHQITPNPMSSSSSSNLSKQGIILFSTVNTVTLPSSSITMDTNKFLMQSNTFNQNFICASASIVFLQNIRKLFVDSDTYIKNSGQYLESLNYYGSITSTGDVSNTNQLPGAYSLFAYYGNSISTSTLQSLISSNSLETYYPFAPLIVDGAFYVSITGWTFDNNAIQELDPSSVSTTFPSNAITILKSQGTLILNSLTFQNYKGFDLTDLQVILGTSGYANVVYKLPTERDSSGTSLTTVTSPSYVIDYAFKNRLVRFGYPSASSTTNFQNYFDTVTIDSAKLSNITQYCPAQQIPVFLDLYDDCTAVTLTNFDFKDIDLVYGSEAMIKVRNYGSLNIQNGTVSNLNVNAFCYDSSAYTYVGRNGGVFSFYSVASSSGSALTYMMTNVTFNNLYGYEGAAIYFKTATGVATARDNYITLSTWTFSNSHSYNSGLVYLYSGLQFVTITGSTFTSNVGVSWEADLYIVTSGSLEITLTTFTLFSATNSPRGTSISFGMSSPFSFQAVLTSLTFKCSSNTFVAATYK